MIKIVAIVRKKPHLSREQFLQQWYEEHPVFVRKLPRIKRYRQNPSIEHKKEWPFDGMAELWFDSVKDVAIAYAGPEAEALRDHEEHFLADMQWSIVEERPIDLPSDVPDPSTLTAPGDDHD